jgi:hypothetical protein
VLDAQLVFVAGRRTVGGWQLFQDSLVSPVSADRDIARASTHDGASHHLALTLWPSLAIAGARMAIGLPARLLYVGGPTVDAVIIPNRFESLQEEFGQGVRPLIVPIDEDLAAFNRFRDRARIQRGGLLCFLLGPTGVGKTTSAHSAAANMPEVFQPVVLVPHQVELREAISWITQRTAEARSGKSIIVLFDGREASDDDVGVRQFLSGLNQFLRRRPDVLFCWPTTDEVWHRKLRTVAENIGGANLCQNETDYQVKGPPPSEWPIVLERLLLQFAKTLDDVGMSGQLVKAFCADSRTVGDFLTKASFAVSERISSQQKTKKLPQLLFVITSSGDVTGEANRIRRAGKQILAAEPLLGHSPRSEAGKWWTQRNNDHSHHLGYIISLFNANLVTMSASAVVHACMIHGEKDLQAAAFSVGAQPNKGNASQALKASEFFRYLSGSQVPEFTTGRKGRVQKSTIKAYANVQALSSKRHKSINQAICGITGEYLEDFNCQNNKNFEVPQGDDLITDVVIETGSRTFHSAFHHLSEAQCKAANMSSYIMGKLRSYAIHHQLIPR